MKLNFYCHYKDICGCDITPVATIDKISGRRLKAYMVDNALPVLYCYDSQEFLFFDSEFFAPEEDCEDTLENALQDWEVAKLLGPDALDLV